MGKDATPKKDLKDHFIMHRTRRISTTLGHVIHFEKGVPTYVPKAIQREVLNRGGVPADEATFVEEEEQRNEAPTDPEQRHEEIMDAMRLMTKRNARDDFGGNGAPAIKAINGLVGYTVTAAERDRAWLELQAELNGFEPE